MGRRADSGPDGPTIISALAVILGVGAVAFALTRTQAAPQQQQNQNSGPFGMLGMFGGGGSPMSMFGGGSQGGFGGGMGLPF